MTIASVAVLFFCLTLYFYHPPVKDKFLYEDNKIFKISNNEIHTSDIHLKTEVTRC